MAEGKFKGEECFTRIMIYIHEPSRRCMQQLIIKRAFDLKPASEPSWDLDRFLQTNRGAIDNRKYRHHKDAFFPPSGKINLDTLDIGRLCILLFNVCDLKGVPAIENSLNEVKDIRNQISHPGRFSLTIAEYDSFKIRCDGFIDLALKFIDDGDFSRKVKQEIAAIENPLPLQTITAYKNLQREIVWSLMEFQGKFEDFTETYSTNINNDNAHRREHVNFMNCQKQDSSEIKDGVQHVLHQFDKILEKLDGTKVAVPETTCTILVKYIDHGKEEQLSRAVVNLINNGTDGSCKNCHNVIEAVEAMRNTDYGPISNGQVACVQLDIHCRNLKELRKLIDDVISGKIQDLIKPLESALRQDFDCPELELEFIIDRDDFWRCMKGTGEIITRTLQNASAIESIGSQSGPEDKESSSHQKSSQSFDRELQPDVESAAAYQHQRHDAVKIREQNDDKTASVVVYNTLETTQVSDTHGRYPHLQTNLDEDFSEKKRENGDYSSLHTQMTRLLSSRDTVETTDAAIRGSDNSQKLVDVTSNRFLKDYRALPNNTFVTEMCSDKPYPPEYTSEKHAIKGLNKDRFTDVTYDRTWACELQKQLSMLYLEHNSTLSTNPFVTDGEFRMEDMYVLPDFIEVLDMPVVSIGEYDCIQQTVVSLEQLLNPSIRQKQFTCITGSAGTGKSSFCKFLTLLWCASHGDNDDTVNTMKESFDISFECLQTFPYLFCIQMRSIPSGHSTSVDDIMFAYLENEFGYKREDRDTLERVLAKERSLVILDGLDECMLSEVRLTTLNQNCSVLTTSRPWKLASMKLPKDMYLLVTLDTEEETQSERFFERVNTCFNARFGTTVKVLDFMAALEAQRITHWKNRFLGVQLYCIWFDRHMKLETLETGEILFGIKTASHIHVDCIEMMLGIGLETNKRHFQNKAVTYMHLPACFEGKDLCNQHSHLIYKVAKMAFSMLYKSCNVLDKSTLEENVLLDETQYLLKSGILSASKSSRNRCRAQMYSFLHKTYQEMLAAVYLSSVEIGSKDWQTFENKFEDVYSPELMSFMCVMNYEQGLRCSELFADTVSSCLREFKFGIREILAYQSAVLYAFKECLYNGVSKPQLALEHVYIDNVNLAADHYILKRNVSSVKTCILQCPTLPHGILNNENLEVLWLSGTLLGSSNPKHFPMSFKNMSVMCLDDLSLQMMQLDLSACKCLKVLVLRDVHLQNVTINPEKIEVLCIDASYDLQKKGLHIELIFAHIGDRFTNRLRELCLVNVENRENVCLKQCEKLQKLQLNKFKFPDDFHLELSTCTNLSEIRLQNVCLRQLTIAPACVQTFWIGINENLQEWNSQIELTLAHGENFTSQLQHLHIVGVRLPNFDLTLCDRLQKLQLHHLIFPDDFHLELSTCFDLTEIKLQNVRLQHLTIAPASIETFLIDNSDGLYENIPPMEVDFVHGEHFTHRLRELHMSNVLLQDDLDLTQCDNLQTLRLEMWLSSDGPAYNDNSVIILNTRPHHVIISLYHFNKYFVENN